MRLAVLPRPTVRIVQRPVEVRAVDCARSTARNAVDARAALREAPVELVADCTTRVAPFGTAPVVVQRPREQRMVVARRATRVAAVGVTAADAADAAEVPASLVAVAVKVYAVPFARPVMVHDPSVGPATVHVRPPGLAVTVNVLTGPPVPRPTVPLRAVMVAWASPASAVGAFGPAGKS